MTDIWRFTDAVLPGRDAARISISDLAIQAGVTAVLGQSGAGKSSLLGLLADFESPASGEIRFDVAAVGNNEHCPVRFWSPQDFGLWSHLSVQEHIEVVQIASDTRSAIDWLQLFDLDALAQSRPRELSMGEKSRLSVLRALASQARCVILDEPLAHVDEARVDRYWQVLESQVKETQATCVFSTHDAICVRRFADHCVCLEDGQVAFAGPVATVLFEPPSEATAWLLGPANFFSEKQRACLFEQESVPVCIRPDELRIVFEPDGFGIRSTRRIAGAYAVELEGDQAPTVFLDELPKRGGRLVFEPSPLRQAAGR
jgi:ABC-type multidrug transport system ATPase subunit